MGKTFSTGLLTNGIWQDASNNIGIGGSPSGSYKLEVTGTARVSSTLLVSGALTGAGEILTSGGQLAFSGSGGAPSTGIGIRYNGTFYVYAGANGFNVRNSANSTNNLTIADSGAATFSSSVTAAGEYVNTSGNASRIFFSGTATTGYQYVNIKNTSASLLYGIEGNTTGNLASGDIAYSSGIYTGTATPLHFGSNQIVAMTITSDNNVGVGLTGVYSDVRFMTRGASATSANYSFRSENSSGGNILYLRNDGLFGSGTLSLSPYSFDPGGHIMYVNSVGQIGSLSSTRESKININTISNIDYIYKLNPVSFNMRKRDDVTYEYTDEYNQEIRYGFIADEVEKLNEDLVVYNNNDGNKKLSSVDYISFIPVLVKAIQELSQQNQDLKSRLDKAGL